MVFDRTDRLRVGLAMSGACVQRREQRGESMLAQQQGGRANSALARGHTRSTVPIDVHVTC